MSEGSISTALAALCGAEFDPVSSIGQQPLPIAELRPGQSTLYAADYELEELDFRQNLIVYPFVFLHKAASTGTNEADRRELYTKLEAVRTAIEADTTLGGITWDARVTNLLVQDGDHLIAGLEVSARVLQ